MIIVPKVTTTPSKAAFLQAMRRAWQRHFFETPSNLTLAILFAQFAFETGWGKYCYNWNLGNVRAQSSYSGSAFELPGAWEIINGVRTTPGGFFRAFPSLDEGAEEHLIFLSTLPRYAKAFNVLTNAIFDDVSVRNIEARCTEFVSALKAGGYFTGDLFEYIKGVTSIAKSFVAEFASQPGDNWEVDEYIPLSVWFDGLDNQNTLASDVIQSLFAEEWRATKTSRFLECRYDCEQLS